jgi:hypothetical protein
MRRVQSLAVSSARTSAAAIVGPKRTLIEPLSVWWTASWAVQVSLSMFFWFPTLIAEWFFPSFTLGKIPHIHYINERKAEFKLRSQLDEIYTVWSTELDSGNIDDAIARTF